MTQLPIEQPLPSQGTGDKPVPLFAAFAKAGNLWKGGGASSLPYTPPTVKQI
jgi:hypothetical protein